ncbi:MAG: FAD-dependent oxidoreductase [Clostridiales bacterium]|nr:FAD-dependent oxidoreductase [Clostridiales bacterium]
MKNFPAFIWEADVVVCGAGTAGSVAALAAADAGAKVMVIEQFGGPGGSSSLGQVTPLMSTHIPGECRGSYLAEEIERRAAEVGASTGTVTANFDPVMLSLVLEEMLSQRGVEMLYHTVITDVNMENGHIESLVVSNKSGSGLVKAKKKYIDATGDADVCALAGLPTLHGDEENHKNQPCSLRYMVGGVDLDAFWKYVQSFRRPGQEPLPRPEHFGGACTLNGGKFFPMDPVFQEAVEKGDLTAADARYWQFFTVPGRLDGLAFNCPEFFDIPDITDAKKISYVQVEGKKRILRYLKFYKKYFPGFENVYLASVSSMVGVRESRRAVTEYILTTEDAFNWRKFEDAIAQTNYPVDVHGMKLRNVAIEGKEGAAPYYEIPFRSLVVKDVDNLLVAGRNLGAEFVAQSSVRIIPTCRSLGEAAGIAAALDISDGKQVRAEMEKRGAKFTR